MDKADLILAAIEQLGRSLNGKIDAVYAELKVDINGVRAELKADINSVRAELGSVRTELKADINGVRAELGSTRTELKADIAHLESEVRTEARVIHARLDEQRQTVNALIPQRIAAVGRGTDAAE